jgi:hypothetical protein
MLLAQSNTEDKGDTAILGPSSFLIYTDRLLWPERKAIS